MMSDECHDCRSKVTFFSNFTISVLIKRVMNIEIPNEVLERNNLSEKELKLELALFLFKRNIFTLESASKFAELDSYQFQKKLGEHKIPIHYSLKDFKDDLGIVNEP